MVASRDRVLLIGSSSVLATPADKKRTPRPCHTEIVRIGGWAAIASACFVVGSSVFAGTAGAASASKAPVAIRVVLPHGYARANTHWPVVYNLNTVLSSCPGPGGEDCDLQQQIVDAAAKRPFITVFQTTEASLTDYIDWADRSQLNDAKYVSLISWVDRRYRTIPDRQHRALSGLSAGAYGAFVIGARHPNLFSQLASISGPLDIRGAADSLEPVFYLLGGPSPATSAWGQPVVKDASWSAANPTDLVARLRGIKVWVANANGVPCDVNDGPQGNPIGSVIEGVVGAGSSSFVRAAKTAGVEVKYMSEPCGVHTYRYFAPRTIRWLNSVRF